jgi:serine/threonine protein phosphatase PrpC
LRGMGTTLTGVRSFGRDLMITHVGDSRAYPRWNPASPHTRPHVCAAADRHRPARAERPRRIPPSSRADERARRIPRGCPGGH